MITFTGRNHFLYIRNISGIFFAASGTRLRFSKYIDPDVWPIAAYLEMDEEITGIEEFYGEGVVYTKSGVHRVRGSTPFTMTSIRIPSSEGLPRNNRGTLAQVSGTLMWLSQNGICMYSDGRVTNITENTVTDKLLMTAPVAAARKSVYWLFPSPEADNERGWKADFRFGLPPRLTSHVMSADYAIYVPQDDVIYINNNINRELSASVENSDMDLPMIWRSKELDAGDPNESKLMLEFEFTYENSEIYTFETAFAGVEGYETLRGFLNDDDLDLELIVGDATSISDAGFIGRDYEDPDVTVDFGGIPFGPVDTTTQKTDDVDEKIIKFNSSEDLSDIQEGMIVWGDLIDNGSKVSSVDNSAKTVTLDRNTLSRGKTTVYFGDLLRVNIFLSGSDTAEPFLVDEPDFTEMVLPPSKLRRSADVYLPVPRVADTVSIGIMGKGKVHEAAVNIQAISSYERHMLYHSMDVSWYGSVKLQVFLDNRLILERELDEMSSDIGQTRIWMPCASYGLMPYYINTTPTTGRIDRVGFNKMDMVA